MIDVSGFELSVGPRTLMSDVSFRISAGDKIGLVGRNGAGKTTMTKVLAGISDDRDGHTFAGTVERGGEIGYLPQDPRSGDPKQTARRRILDARGIGAALAGGGAASGARNASDAVPLMSASANRRASGSRAVAATASGQSSGSVLKQRSRSRRISRFTAGLLLRLRSGSSLCRKD